MQAVGGHTFRVFAAADSIEGVTQDTSNMNACTTCHAGLTSVNRTANGDYDGDGVREGIQDEVRGLLDLGGALLPPLGDPAVVVTADYNSEQLKAAYNYMLVLEDKSLGVHNSMYLVQLLQSSYHALAGTDVPGAQLLITWPSVVPTFTPTPTRIPAPVATSTPTPTPTPIVVPSAEGVSVTDNVNSTTDLSNGEDHDANNQRILVIRWNLASLGLDASSLKDVHVYVKEDGQEQYTFLGRTGDGSAGYLEWKAGASVVASYVNGPQFGRSYQFRVYTMTLSGSPMAHGPYDNAGPVQFLPMITVTDDLASLVDLTGGQDADPASNRQLVIRWNPDDTDFDPSDIQDYHIYVMVNNAAPAFLVRTGSGAADAFEWIAGAARVNTPFAGGPEFNNSYQFMVFAMTASGTPRMYGPLNEAGAVTFLPTP